MSHNTSNEHFTQLVALIETKVLYIRSMDIYKPELHISKELHIKLTKIHISPIIDGILTIFKTDVPP